MEKTCARCGELKNLDYFGKRSKEIDGISKVCKSCYKEDVKRYRKSHPDKVENWRLKRIFGISLKEKESIILSQDNKCSICKEELKDNIGCLDHNHRNNKIRGVLCNRCNVMIGLAQDNIKILENALEYIKKWE